MSQKKSSHVSIHNYYLKTEQFSEEEMIRDWTLSEVDKAQLMSVQMNYQLFIALQLLAVKLYGRFLRDVNHLSPRISSYLCTQLGQPPSLFVEYPDRKATLSKYRKQILTHLGFQKFTKKVEAELIGWLKPLIHSGVLPDHLSEQAQQYLLEARVLLPGKTILDRLIHSTFQETQGQLFENIYHKLSPDLRKSIDALLEVDPDKQHSFFQQLKEYPPAAGIRSLKLYLSRYQKLSQIKFSPFENYALAPQWVEHFYKLAISYHAKDLKRFKKSKKYMLMLCFLLERKKMLTDYLIQMHEQYIAEILRQSKNSYQRSQRKLRRTYKKAVDMALFTTETLLDWPEEEEITTLDLWEKIDKQALSNCRIHLKLYKEMEEKGLGHILLRRYPSLRKYFAHYIDLPFKAALGSESILLALELLKKLDQGVLNQLPDETPLDFVPKELEKLLYDEKGTIKRNAWELSLAIILKDALRSGDIYLEESKNYVSFWNLMLSEQRWKELEPSTYSLMGQPEKKQVHQQTQKQFIQEIKKAQSAFPLDDFAKIEGGKLKLKKDDKAQIPDQITRLQKTLDASLPIIRIEKLLQEVDRHTRFTRHFIPEHPHNSRPKDFYTHLMATLISQATNLGVVAMSASMKHAPVDRLRHILSYYIREETLKAANAEIVNHHHKLPLSSIHGSGEISSSDAQRFGIRASSLLASYYPRYYGYYEKAIGIYTHVSDQYSVFNTKAISCGPREALYVLDGLLENNTILKPLKHTTDTAGYTEIIFALCHLLGYYFMPRIRDLKDQQLYRIDTDHELGVFSPLLSKKANPKLIEEQWSEMIRVARSLQLRTAPAHVVVQRLMNASPADNLAKAFTHFGRIIKTQYILRYISDPKLRRSVQLQLNKGEYRHNLPRKIFFANQGKFTTGDYTEIMNKASCLSLVSNAILYWNTQKIQRIVHKMRKNGQIIEDDVLKHISLLPYKHIIPNGTYFID
ncbi:MAG: Tn3 family transposase [Bacteroidia bacterium]|nr:Tn3 family transposase [Bacteroidia bacterium]